MSTTTTHIPAARLIGTLAVLVGLIASMLTLVVPPASAADPGTPAGDCATSQGNFTLGRLLVEFGGDVAGLDGSDYLDTDVDPWCYDGNDIVFVGYTPKLHISCSEDLTGIEVSGFGDITEFWLDSRNLNPLKDGETFEDANPDRERCQSEDTFPRDPVASVDIVKTNNADGDLPFTDTETASAAGQNVDFQVVITNDGPVPGTVSLTDQVGDAAAITLFGAGSGDPSATCLKGAAAFSVGDVLGVGESITCSWTMTGYAPAAGGSLDNTAVVTLDTQYNDPTASDDSTVNTPSPDPVASVDIVKTNNADGDLPFTDTETASAAGQNVDFQVVITNDGPVPGTVSLTDQVGDAAAITLFGAGSGDPSATCLKGAAAFSVGDVLGVGESITCSWTMTGYAPAAGGSLDNTAVVTLDTQYNDPTASDDSTVNTPSPDPVASVDIVKTNNADGDLPFTDTETASAAGQNVDFQVVITNDGPVPGTVSLTDQVGDAAAITLFGAGSGDPSATCLKGAAAFSVGDVLGVGESITCSWTMTGYAPAAGGSLDNTAVVTLDTQYNDPTASDDSTVNTPSPQSRLIEIIKVLTNPDGTFLQSELPTPNYLVELFEGTDTSGDPIAFDSPTASYEDRLGELLGDTYTVTETAPGWNDVECAPEVMQGFGASSDGLGPFQFPAVIDTAGFASQSDLFRVSLISEVVQRPVWTHLVCNAEIPPPPPPPPPSPDPDIDLVKSPVIGGDSDLTAVEGGVPQLSWNESVTEDQTAVYSYVITNTGEEALVNLALTDDRIGDINVDSCADPLPVDATCTVTASETFSSDQAAALIINTGEVTATGAQSRGSVSADDPATIELTIVNPTVIERQPIEIDLVKDVVLGEGDVDDEGVVTWSSEDFEDEASKTVVYRLTVTNVGDNTIVDIELNDPMLSAEPLPLEVTTLAPGESTTVEVSYTLTFDEAFPDGEALPSSIDNVAMVTGSNEAGNEAVKATDDATVNIGVVFDAVLEVTGLDSGALLPFGLLLMALGALVLWIDRRRGMVQ